MNTKLENAIHARRLEDLEEAFAGGWTKVEILEHDPYGLGTYFGEALK